MMKNAGFNLVNYSHHGANVATEWVDVQKILLYAQKNEIGWFLNDDSLKNVVDGSELATKVGQYGYYDSFFGLHIVDEPTYEKSAASILDSSKNMSNYAEWSKKLNQYSNLMGYINLAPEDSTCTDDVVYTGSC